MVLSFGYLGFYTPTAPPTGLVLGVLVPGVAYEVVVVFLSVLALSILGVEIFTSDYILAGSSSFDLGVSFFLSISTSSIPYTLKIN